MLFAESAWNAATTQTMVPPIHNLSVKNFDEMEKRMQDSYEHFIQIFAGYIIDDTAKEGEDGQWNLVFEVREEFTMRMMRKIEGIIVAETLHGIYASQAQANELSEYYKDSYVKGVISLRNSLLA